MIWCTNKVQHSILLLINKILIKKGLNKLIELEQYKSEIENLRNDLVELRDSL